MQNLTIRCGPRALARIRQDGLQPAAIDIVPAAAGGPKGLALHGLDCALFGDWLPRAPKIRYLVGASIGAWRMAAAALPDPVAGLKLMADLYVAQKYPAKPSSTYVADYCRQLVANFVAGYEHDILSNPHYRLSVLTVRGKRRLAESGPRQAAAGFAAAALANMVSRRHLGHWLDRTWLFDPRDKPPMLPLEDFHTHEVPLTTGNLKPALLASGAIPLVIDAVKDIAGAPKGNYWDGGLIDYHLHLPYNRSPGLVLYPHFIDGIIPGWLDKSLPWRRASGPWLDNMVLLSPSPEFVSKLPRGKLPDRSDFKHYGSNGHEERMRVWRQAIGEGQRLGDEFLNLAESGEIAARAQSF